MKNRVSRCKGVARLPHQWSPSTIQLFDRVLPQVREQFIKDAQDPTLWQGEVLVGRRVMNDTDVLLVIRSWASDQQFNQEPLTWVLDGLQDCAERDWWYSDKGDKVWEDACAATEV